MNRRDFIGQAIAIRAMPAAFALETVANNDPPVYIDYSDGSTLQIRRSELGPFLRSQGL